jgi:hypothetical protein
MQIKLTTKKNIENLSCSQKKKIYSTAELLSFKKLENLTLLNLENIKIILPEYKVHREILTIAKKVQLHAYFILISKISKVAKFYL